MNECVSSCSIGIYSNFSKIKDYKINIFNIKFQVSIKYAYLVIRIVHHKNAFMVGIHNIALNVQIHKNI